MKVLFVCSGNICRSPMAEAWARHRSAGAGMSHLVVASAGLLGLEGVPASPEAVEAMREAGVDLSRHRSRGLRRTDVRTADLIIGMSEQHLEVIDQLYPGRGGERYLLRAFEFGPEPTKRAPQLDDPVGAPLEVFREQRDVIETCVDHLLLHLKHDDG